MQCSTYIYNTGVYAYPRLKKKKTAQQNGRMVVDECGASEREREKKKINNM